MPGRTIVVGTEQGLYARVVPLAQPVLRLRSTRDDGTTAEREFPLDADLLAKVGWCGLREEGVMDMVRCGGRVEIFGGGHVWRHLQSLARLGRGFAPGSDSLKRSATGAQPRPEQNPP